MGALVGGSSAAGLQGKKLWSPAGHRFQDDFAVPFEQLKVSTTIRPYGSQNTSPGLPFIAYPEGTVPGDPLYMWSFSGEAQPLNSSAFTGWSRLYESLGSYSRQQCAWTRTAGSETGFQLTASQYPAFASSTTFVVVNYRGYSMVNGNAWGAYSNIFTSSGARYNLNDTNVYGGRPGVSCLLLGMTDGDPATGKLTNLEYVQDAGAQKTNEPMTRIAQAMNNTGSAASYHGSNVAMWASYGHNYTPSGIVNNTYSGASNGVYYAYYSQLHLKRNGAPTSLRTVTPPYIGGRPVPPVWQEVHTSAPHATSVLDAYTRFATAPQPGVAVQLEIGAGPVGAERVVGVINLGSSNISADLSPRQQYIPAYVAAGERVSVRPVPNPVDANPPTIDFRLNFIGD